MEIEVKKFYKPFNGMTSVFYRDLAQLPFTLYLTTIPAPFLANAFPAEKAPQIDYYHFRRPRPATALEAHRPIVYHLYGDLTAVDSLNCHAAPGLVSMPPAPIRLTPGPLFGYYLHERPGNSLMDTRCLLTFMDRLY